MVDQSTLTRDEIIRMAHETGVLDEQHYGSSWSDRLERFAALVSDAERESCAKVCDDWGIDTADPMDLGDAIRAGGKHA